MSAIRPGPVIRTGTALVAVLLVTGLSAVPAMAAGGKPTPLVSVRTAAADLPPGR